MTGAQHASVMLWTRGSRSVLVQAERGRHEPMNDGVRPSFGAQTTTDEVLAGTDLHGAAVVVTGASTGLGLETARALAGAGAHVLLGVRDSTKGIASVA